MPTAIPQVGGSPGRFLHPTIDNNPPQSLTADIGEIAKIKSTSHDDLSTVK